METVEIEGTTYIPATAIAEQVGVCRQTLWRWRQGGKIPSGHRHRNGQVLFTREEADAVCAFANRVDPIDSSAYPTTPTTATMLAGE